MKATPLTLLAVLVVSLTVHGQTASSAEARPAPSAETRVAPASAPQIAPTSAPCPVPAADPRSVPAADPRSVPAPAPRPAPASDPRPTTSARSPFRKGYFRLGINTLGSTLNNQLSPKANVFDGRFGANLGYVFESGHVFYFRGPSKAKLINYGLDWTFLSATYNPTKKWASYGQASGAQNVSIEDGKLAVSVASKLGPVVSFNPVEKLVIDVRFQVAPTARLFVMDYLENDGAPNQRSWAYANYGEEDLDNGFDSDALKNRVAFAVEYSAGISVRRKAIGLALDYSFGKTKLSYDATEGFANHTFGKAKVPVKGLQLKLSVTL